MLLAMQPPSLQLSFVVSGKQVEPSYSDQYSQPLLTKSWKWAQTVPSWKEGRSYSLQLHRLRWCGKALSHSSINALQPGLQTKIMFRKTTTSLLLQDHHWANSPTWRNCHPRRNTYIYNITHGVWFHQMVLPLLLKWLPRSCWFLGGLFWIIDYRFTMNGIIVSSCGCN
jgi:hypothetical protein